MEKLDKIINVLPLTFQNSETIKLTNLVNSGKSIIVKNIGSESKESQNFYKPISKMIIVK